LSSLNSHPSLKKPLGKYLLLFLLFLLLLFLLLFNLLVIPFVGGMNEFQSYYFSSRNGLFA
jgi:hypothetical protein